MLPKELTAEQNKIPSLTAIQLKRLGFQTNHEWKINAYMLGFNLEEDIDDFIEELTTTSQKTFLKGEQLVCYIYEGNVKNFNFPIAFEGNVIFLKNGRLLVLQNGSDYAILLLIEILLLFIVLQYHQN